MSSAPARLPKAVPCTRFSVDVAPDAVGLSAERLAGLDKFISQLCEQERLPCANLSIMRKGMLAYDCAAGYAQVESRAPVQRDTIHRMYSMSKPIVSAALMMKSRPPLIHS